VAEFIESRKIQIPPEQMEEAMVILNRQILKQMIDAKLVYNDAIHTIPKEGIAQITANLNKEFDKDQLPDLMKANGATSPQDLDQKLRAKGTSLDRARRVSIEKKLMYGWIGKQVNQDEQVPLANILGYYEEHLEDYKFAAQARWEELMVSFVLFPDKESAFAALAEMERAQRLGATYHLALIDAAKGLADSVVMSVFVNPLQFGPSEDFDRYPRTLDEDAKLAGKRGVDFLFTPTREDMYPEHAPVVIVHPGSVGKEWEGAVRPHHFEGVLTVVAKLFHIIMPDVAVFGQKDLQQAACIKAMVRDLNFPVGIHVAPTVRDPDGLAMSSLTSGAYLQWIDKNYVLRSAKPELAP
jgi:hypothetical protein